MLNSVKSYSNVNYSTERCDGSNPIHSYQSNQLIQFYLFSKLILRLICLLLLFISQLPFQHFLPSDINQFMANLDPFHLVVTG